MFDSLYMIEVAAVHFFRRAELGRHIKGKKAAQVDADYEKAAYLAALAVPFRHARLSATKILGDPNSPLRIRDDASADEIRAEIMKRLEILTSAGLVDLQALPAPNGETVRQVRRGERSRTSAGTFLAQRRTESGTDCACTHPTLAPIGAG
jgi:hypothetical protein